MEDRLERLQKIVQDLALYDYNKGRRDALDEVMAYSYGMLTAEKYGLQHFIESKRRETYREEERDDYGRSDVLHQGT